jgi:hypothetical protein
MGGIVVRSFAISGDLNRHVCWTDKRGMQGPSGKILFLCAHCGKHLAARAELAGKTAHCVRCRAEVNVPLGHATGVPAPQPRAAALDSRGGTMAGEPSAFDTQVVPSPEDVSATMAPRADDPVVAAPAVFRPARGAVRAPRTFVRRVVLPMGAGALAAGAVIAVMAVVLHSAAAPRRAQGDVEKPAAAVQPAPDPR